VKWVVPAPALYTAMDSQHSLCLPLNVPTVLIVDGATGPKVSGGSSQLLEILEDEIQSLLSIATVF
jgi:hypothetical protein